MLGRLHDLFIAAFMPEIRCKQLAEPIRLLILMKSSLRPLIFGIAIEKFITTIATKNNRHILTCLFCNKTAWYQTVISKRFIKIRDIIVEYFQKVVSCTWTNLDRDTQRASYIYSKVTFVKLLVFEACRICTQILVELGNNGANQRGIYTSRQECTNRNIGIEAQANGIEKKFSDHTLCFIITLWRREATRICINIPICLNIEFSRSKIEGEAFTCSQLLHFHKWAIWVRDNTLKQKELTSLYINMKIIAIFYDLWLRSKLEVFTFVPEIERFLTQSITSSYHDILTAVINNVGEHPIKELH